MKLIQKPAGFTNPGLTGSQWSEFINLGYSQGCIHQINFAVQQGLTRKQIDFLLHKKFDFRQMRTIRLGFVHGLSMKQVNLFAKKQYGDCQMSYIQFAINKSKLSRQQIVHVLKDKRLRKCASQAVYYYAFKFIKSNMPLNDYEYVFNTYADNSRILETIADCFPSLSVQKIASYYQRGFNHQQILTISYAGNQMPDKSCVALLQNVDYTDDFMDEIIKVSKRFKYKQNLRNKIVLMILEGKNV